MKFFSSILFISFYNNCPAQVIDSLNKQPANGTGKVSFITTLDIANATKDGIYLNGYVVNLDYEKAKMLDGKKIKVKGRARMIRGLKNRPGYDPEKTGYLQGRNEDYKYIRSPKIRIIEK